MSTDAAQWRKLLVSHCAFTTMQAADLPHADTLKTCTGAIIKVRVCVFLRVFHVFVFVCLCVCVFVCMDVCMYVRMYGSMYGSMDVWMDVWMDG